MGLIRMAKRGQREKPCDSQAIFIQDQPQGATGTWPPKPRMTARAAGPPAAGVIKGGRFNKASSSSVQKLQPRGMSALDEDDDKWAHDRWQGVTPGRTSAAARRRAAMTEEDAWEPEMPVSRQRAQAQRPTEGPVPDNRMRGWSEGENGNVTAAPAVIQKPASVKMVGPRKGTGIAKYRTISVRKAIEKRPASGGVLTGGARAGSGALRSRAASAKPILMPRSEEQDIDDSAYSNSGLLGRLPGKGSGKGSGKGRGKAGRGAKGRGKAGKGRGKGKKGKGW